MLRDMTADDVGFVIEMLYALREESPRYATVVPDEEYVASNLRASFSLPSFIGSVDTDQRGFMFGQASSSWYDPQVDAYEQLLYIAPHMRGGFLAARLIKDFEKKARNLGCHYVRGGVSTLMRTEQTLRLYERLGYERNGYGVTKRII